MPALALVLLALYGLLAFGVRMAFQRRRTGSTGFKGLPGAHGLLGSIGGLLFVVSLLLCVAGPSLQLAGLVNPIRALDGAGADMLGAVLVALGIVLTVTAQFAMGDAWRIGLDPVERTQLVVRGPFSVVRNPIFAAMIPAFVGVALLAPNALTILGAILLMAALELDVRLIEEPYLSRVHGEAYAAYGARVGRFFPGIGRLRLNRR